VCHSLYHLVVIKRLTHSQSFLLITCTCTSKSNIVSFKLWPLLTPTSSSTHEVEAGDECLSVSALNTTWSRCLNDRVDWVSVDVPGGSWMDEKFINLTAPSIDNY
jgi:hypothetical protein